MTVPIRLIASGYRRTNITSAENLGASDASDMRMVVKVIVVAVGATNSSVIDSTGVTPTPANTILVVPAGTIEGTIYELECPFMAGIGVVPGTGATLCVVWQ
jgi:hypothetical protein